MKRKLTIDELQYVQDEVKQKGKSTGLTYILAILVGYLGIHLGYLEKKKLAVVRVVLSIIAVASVFLMGSTVNALQSSELTMRLEQYSSAITVVMTAAVLIQFIWFLFDLISIPGEVRAVNESIEDKATDSIIHSRYAAESIMKDEMYQSLTEKIRETIHEKLEEELDKKAEESKKKITSIGNTVKARELEVKAISNKLEGDIEQVKKLSKNLEDNVNSIQLYMIKEFGGIKSEVKEIVASKDDNEADDKDVILSEPEDNTVNKTEDNTKEVEDKNDVEYEAKEDVSGEDEHKESEVNISEDKVDESEVVQESEVIQEKAKSVTEDKETAPVADEVSLETNKSDEILKITEDSSPEITEITEPTISKETPDASDSILADDNKNQDTNDSEIEAEVLSTDNDTQSKTNNYISVEEAICINGEVNTEGYIVGCVDEGSNLTKDNFRSNSNIAIADNVDENEIENTLIVQLPKNSNFRNEFGLKSSPENINVKVNVNGRRKKYFSQNGLKGVKDISFSDK